MFDHIDTISCPGTLAYVQLILNSHMTIDIVHAHVFFPNVTVTAKMVQTQIEKHAADLLADASRHCRLYKDFAKHAVIEVKTVIDITFSEGDRAVVEDEDTDLTMQISSFEFDSDEHAK